MITWPSELAYILLQVQVWIAMRHRIYIPLAGQPNALRASEAKAVGNGHFAVAGPVAAGECWQYMPGELVVCESRKLPDGSNGLVAVSSVSPDPESRSRRKVYGWCGALVGGILGLSTAMLFGVGGVRLLVVAAFCSVAFAWSSMRWGDDAWELLAKFLG